MKIHEVSQNSLEWLSLRSGVVTASEIDAIVSPLFKLREGKGVETYLHQKLAERWTGGPLPGFMDIDMELGKILEDEAIPWYELEYGCDVRRVGLVTDDAMDIGCSPDGLIGEDGGVEIKCPTAKTHVGYLLAGVVPSDYIAQVHFSMFVTGRKWWDFVSYRRGFPNLVIRVNRDDEIMAVFAKATEAFKAKLDAGMAALVKLNGGIQPKRVKFDASKYAEQPNQGDIIP